MLQLVLPDPSSISSITPLIRQTQKTSLTPLCAISPLSLSSPISIDLDSDDISTLSTHSDSIDSNTAYTSDSNSDSEVLENLMDSLPEEIRQQIWQDVLLHPCRSLQLSLMRINRKTYKQIAQKIYRDVVLTQHNVRGYFYGLGEAFGGENRPEERWPVSGPGIMPLHLLGLSYDPSHRVSPFIRKFTLCNLVERLTICDAESFLVLLEAASEAYVYGMNTWVHRVLFDQIDSITLGATIFEELDKRPLVWRGMLSELWNIIKGDSVIIKFPHPSRPLKEDTYRMAISALGTPSSLGQENRLLDEVVIYTPKLDGIDLGTISASKVKIHLIVDNQGNGGGEGDATATWIGCNEKTHPECLSQEAQLRRFLRRHWLVGMDNTEYIGVPQEVERVTIYNVAAYNRRRCLTGRLSTDLQYIPAPADAGAEGRQADAGETPSLPTVLYGAMEGDEQLALEVDSKVHLMGPEDASQVRV
ncbi:uncharacterized protein I303_102335 [Kwoniella dejecticola CBS 10117]|uniref:F-box domain-containing protein n=1 Tax=Kwoniella dejecticola CBS 10117 TaxID=1296121 RepID=A0A1A6AB87_9TREE|nr:uncharacterized protein I303_01524 [Kwoniella dejecticola CBS 10117]OBR87322.1 hypothetical protein I303_01524 [Kwoniella dejecticola CBS 10117]